MKIEAEILYGNGGSGELILFADLVTEIVS